MKIPCKEKYLLTYKETNVKMSSAEGSVSKRSSARMTTRRDVRVSNPNPIAWTTYFARAPLNSDQCLEACYYGCSQRVKEDDD
jgi:hypothetical protein